MVRATSINHRLLKNISIALCTIAIFKITLSYIWKYKSENNFRTLLLPIRSLSLCSSNQTRQSTSSRITCDQCRLSLKESDGWFCEFDDEWQRRKIIHHMQDKKNRVSDERTFFFLNNWEPTVHCEFERRLGSGEGGKWVCDLHKLKINSSTPPLIYSFGSNDDFKFEKAIKEELPDSEIHTFDQNLFICPVEVCTFHQTYLGDGENGSKSLPMIINDLGHRQRDIDILKVDIEGNEFSIFQEWFNSLQNAFTVGKNSKSNILPYIRQILCEIHLRPNTTEQESRHAHNFFETFRFNHYAIFHKEANINNCQNVFEYAFIRLNPNFFF